MRILLVEDQPEVSEMMCDLLKRIGYDPACVSNGLEALDMIREKPGYFDLIITDHNMPKMTGLELVNQVHCDFPDLRGELSSQDAIGHSNLLIL